MTLTDEQRARIRATKDFWLATVRPEPGGHLVPIWAVLVDDLFYIGIEPHSQKARNVRAHPRAAIALPDTRDVLIVEGAARLLDGEPPAGVAARFQEKYDWSFDPRDGKWVLLELVPDKIHSWNSD